MSHYASALCFLKIKKEFLTDFICALETYKSDNTTGEYYIKAVNTLYKNMDIKKPYYVDWMFGYHSYDKSYVEEYSKDFTLCEFDNDVYVVETTAARMSHLSTSIMNVSMTLADGYIIIMQCEDFNTYLDTYKVNTFDCKFTDVVRKVMQNESIKVDKFNFDSYDGQRLCFTQKDYREPHTVFGYNFDDD